jgi:hypothetical protein
VELAVLVEKWDDVRGIFTEILLTGVKGSHLIILDNRSSRGHY